MNHQTSSVPQIAYQPPQVSTQPMTESPIVDSGLAVLVFSPGDDPNACLNKEMDFLTVVASSSTGYKSNATSSGRNNASGQAKVVKCYNCQGEGHMARKCTQPKRPRNAAWYKDKAMLAEAQEAGQILDEEQLAFLADPGVPDGQAVQTIIPNNAAFQTEDLDTYDSDCDDISNAKAVLMANISNYGSDVISEVPHSETYLNDMENQSVHAMQDFKQTPVVDVTDNEITSDSNIIPHSQYLQETQQINNFEKRFVPQQELSAEQAFWLRMSNPTSKSFDASPVKIKAPKELPKVSLVNESLKKLKFHLARFNKVVKIRTTPDAHIFNVFDKDLLNEIMEVQTVFNQMDVVVQQSSVDEQCLEIAKKELLLENDRLLQQIMSQDVLLTVMNSMSLIGESVFKDQFGSIKKTRVRTEEQSDSLIDKLNLKCAENEDLKAQIQNKVFVITSLKNDLRKLKEKEIVDIDAQIPSANTIVPRMFKLDLEPLAPRLLQNREAHIHYLKYTREQANILRGIVEQAKAKQPLDNALDFACKNAKRIQELLVYV
ncbi:retrovirus-related pol polyprotein from transposon TNT 1-94 [Tanacetum coccineum]|uniref:Retrovirus-related pol polyprotein from transposon TNT 1-94 n=1 Tax=Tanacetum coccineum TaxID=301880 RepID=A0ABQ4WUZ3_9ASTR